MTRELEPPGAEPPEIMGALPSEIDDMVGDLLTGVSVIKIRKPHITLNSHLPFLASLYPPLAQLEVSEVSIYRFVASELSVTLDFVDSRGDLGIRVNKSDIRISATLPQSVSKAKTKDTEVYVEKIAEGGDRQERLLRLGLAREILATISRYYQEISPRENQDNR